MTGRRMKVWRLAVAAFLIVPASLFGVVATSQAAPSEAEVAAAKARLEQLGHETETAIERYNDAEYQLEKLQDRLSAARAKKEAAEREATAARTRLSERAGDAYTQMGTQLDVLLGAQSFTEFSDRLEFMGALAESDAGLAAEADTASQRAEWAAADYGNAVGEAKVLVQRMRDERARIEALFAEQESLYDELDDERQTFLTAQRAAAAAAAAAETQADNNDGFTGGDDGGGGYVPPPDATKAQIAVGAAYAVLGTEYVWGSDDPSVGLDCSGLTAYAWAQAGVYLPHSAAAQYSSLPRVPLSEVQPGDIIYYGNFGPHVALYVGGGNIIHARNPAPGGQVQLDGMYAYDQPWGAVRVVA